ncbi:MAG: ABATE domain-containing protein [Candidatus Eremiobacteraeota bacterium]|nr:ABATE domain-containing protein [Candidatus Eremiobacteraeota bacterium]
MSTVPASDAQFPFHHGRLALSFVGTVGDRGSVATERVGTPRALAAWLLAAGLVAERVTPSPAQVRRALALREAIARTVRALVAGDDPGEPDVELINGVARRWGPRLSLDPRTLTFVHATRTPIETALGRIAADAIELLGDPDERSRLRTCGLDSCAAIFLTPAGRRERRWCSMERCGNRAKVASFRTRQAT